VGLRDDIDGILAPIKTRIVNAIARAVVQRVNDAAKLQSVQIGVEVGEDIDDAERFQEYGFSSIPLEGAEAVVVFPNGDRAHALIVGVDDRRHRPTGGEPGEVVMYSDEGDEVALRRGNKIVASTSGEVLLGSDAATAFVALANLVKSELDTIRSQYNGHTHVETGGTTAVPVPLIDPIGDVEATKVKAE
jgi:phage baseplate assembly protein V